VRAEEACVVGMKVRVREQHRILERRGMVGKVVGRYGGEEYVAVDVRFPDGQHRLFRPGDLEEIASPQPPLWRFSAGWRKQELERRAQVSRVRFGEEGR
jgi:hypothetical protein